MFYDELFSNYILSHVSNMFNRILWSLKFSGKDNFLCLYFSMSPDKPIQWPPLCGYRHPQLPSPFPQLPSSPPPPHSHCHHKHHWHLPHLPPLLSPPPMTTTGSVITAIYNYHLRYHYHRELPRLPPRTPQLTPLPQLTSPPPLLQFLETMNYG